MKRIIFILLFIFPFSANSQSEEILSPGKYFQKAEQLYRKGHCENALEPINKTIAAQINNWEAYQLRAKVYECLKIFDKAITDYSILILWQPENAEFLFSRGILRYRVKQYQMALNDLDKALMLPIRETNQVFFSSTKGESGISGLATIETLHSEMLNYMGLCYHELHHYDSAITSFSEAILQKIDAKYLNNRALSYEALERWDEAALDYEKALSLNENDEIVKYNLIIAYGKMGETEKQKQLLKTLNTHNQLPEIYIYKGVNAYNSGDYKRSLAFYDSAIHLESNKDYFIYRGQANEKLQLYDQAISDYQQALLLDQTYPVAYFSLGNTYYSKNELDSAKICYDLSILYDDKYYKAYLNRAIVFLRKDEIEKACQSLMIAKKGGLDEAINLHRKKCVPLPDQ